MQTRPRFDSVLYRALTAHFRSLTSYYGALIKHYATMLARLPFHYKGETR